MADLRTERLLLHPLEPAEAERIAAQQPGTDDAWAEGFPDDGNAGSVQGFLRRTADRGDQQPFGWYRITRLADGLAIGGICFKGRPESGRCEIGYGLIASARGHGYAAEAVSGLVAIATNEGVACLVADTALDNVASQKTLLHAGFRHVASDTELHHYELPLEPTD